MVPLVVVGDAGALAVALKFLRRTRRIGIHSTSRKEQVNENRGGHHFYAEDGLWIDGTPSAMR